MRGRAKKRPLMDAERLPGERVVPVGDREFKQKVTEKMGSDGIVETHIEYEPTKKSGFRKAGAGKGDRLRAVNKKRYDDNYERIFGHG